MDFWSWLYLALIALSGVGALLLSRLVPLSVTGGAAVAFCLSLLADLWYLELLALLAITVGLFFLLRFFPRRRQTSLEAMVGKSCTVTERIDPLTGGQVEIEGGLWAARALSASEGYEVGAQLTVVAIEGVKLICR